MNNPTEQPKTETQKVTEFLEQVSESKSPVPLEVQDKVIDEIMKSKDTTVLEMPTPEDRATEPPQEAPKISVAPPSPPKLPQQQKTIHVDLQMEAIAKRICKLKGHTIEGVVLHTTQMIKELGAIPFQNTIVICKVCGASLAQIRG